MHLQDAGHLGSVFIHTATRLVRILSIALNKRLLSKQASASQGVNVKDRHFNTGRGEGAGNTSPCAGTRTRAPAPLSAPRRRPCLSHRPSVPDPQGTRLSPLGASTLGCLTLHSWLLWVVSEAAQALMGPTLVFPQPVSTHTGPATRGAWGLPEFLRGPHGLLPPAAPVGPPPRPTRRGTSPEEGQAEFLRFAHGPDSTESARPVAVSFRRKYSPLYRSPGQAARSGPGHRV